MSNDGGANTRFAPHWYHCVPHDATASRLGKRKPYILLGAPIAALGFAAIPLMLGRPLPLFMLATVLMVLAADVIRTPIISLMPDRI